MDSGFSVLPQCLCNHGTKRKTHPPFGRQAAIFQMDSPQILLQTPHFVSIQLFILSRSYDSCLPQFVLFGMEFLAIVREKWIFIYPLAGHL